jgi:hypothetical protein
VKTFRLLPILIFFILGALPSLYSQGHDPQVIARMENALKEAAELQSSQLQEVLVRLEPLLSELRQIRQKGELTPATSQIYQEALLLLLRTQAKLLVPEAQIQTSLRDLMVLNPKMDDSTLNPREKILLEKIRSAETGKLILQTNPPQCSLIYLGIDLGTTPADITLIAGSYNFVLRKPGYRDQSFEAEIKSAEILTMHRIMRRNAVRIPLSVSPRDASVSLNGQAIGSGQSPEAWLSSLPEDIKAQMEAEIRSWNIESAVSGFLLLPEVPIDETVSVEFKAPCFEAVTIKATIQDQDVDLNRPYCVHPELRHVTLKKTVGWLEVSSVPSEADVWIDGKQQGTTPFRQELCIGMHRIQIYHRSGQYVQDVTIPRGETIKISGIIRPAISFLGLYSQSVPGGPLTLLSVESERMAAKLASQSKAFNIYGIAPGALQSMRARGELPIERLLDNTTGTTEADNLIKGIATSAGRANLLIFGLRSGNRFLFRIYNTIHPLADLMEIPNLGDVAQDFLIQQLNKADQIASRLKTASLGMHLMDSPKGPVILKFFESPPPESKGLEPGAILLAVDQKPRNVREIELYLPSLSSGQPVTLEIAPRKETRMMVPVPITYFGAEYPWSSPDAPFNAVLSMLQHLIEKEPLSEEAKFARLSVARGLMVRAEWKLALEFLSRANLEPHKTGICPGTVLYYQARCYEALGDQASAERFYNRAKEYPEATVGTAHGMALSTLAEQRIQRMKRAAQ